MFFTIPRRSFKRVRPRVGVRRQLIEPMAEGRCQRPRQGAGRLRRVVQDPSAEHFFSSRIFSLRIAPARRSSSAHLAAVSRVFIISGMPSPVPPSSWTDLRLVRFVLPALAVRRNYSHLGDMPLDVHCNRQCSCHFTEKERNDKTAQMHLIMIGRNYIGLWLR